MLESQRVYRPLPSAEETCDRPALVVRRGARREEQDLFAPVSESNPPASIRTGERGENSVLFSLDVLKMQSERPESYGFHSGAAAKPGPLGAAERGCPATAYDDDAGAIDLKALVQATGGSLAYKPLSLSEPPMAAFAQDIPDPEARKRTLTRVGIATAACAAIAALSAVILVSGSEAERALGSGNLDVRADIRGEALGNPRTIAASDDEPEHKRKGHARSGLHSGARSGAQSSGSSSRSSSLSAAPAAPAAPKSVDRCGCHGVLACVIRCSATGK